MKFKLLSIKFSISYSLLCFVAISIICGMFSSVVCCMAAVIIHEIGHILPMIKFRCLPENIKISLFEITINNRTRQLRSLKQNLIINFFGPIANFICFILFYLLYLFCTDYFRQIAFANLCVGVFNLLPLMSLDGGQILYLILRNKLSDKASENCVNIVTFIMLLPLAVLGFLLLFNSNYNFSLLFVCVYIIFSLIFKNNRYY